MTEWLSDWVTEWVSDWVTEWVSDWVSEWLTEWLSDWVTEWLSDWLTEWLSEWLTEWLSEWLGEWLSEWLSEWVSEWVSDWVSEWMSFCVYWEEMQRPKNSQLAVRLLCFFFFLLQLSCCNVNAIVAGRLVDRLHWGDWGLTTDNWQPTHFFYAIPWDSMRFCNWCCDNAMPEYHTIIILSVYSV